MVLWCYSVLKKLYVFSYKKKESKIKRFECFDVIIFYFGIIFHVLFTIVSLIGIFYNVFYLNDFNSMDVVIYFIMFLINYFIGVIFRMIVIKNVIKALKKIYGEFYFLIYLF